MTGITHEVGILSKFVYFLRLSMALRRLDDCPQIANAISPMFICFGGNRLIFRLLHVSLSG